MQRGIFCIDCFCTEQNMALNIYINSGMIIFNTVALYYLFTITLLVILTVLTTGCHCVFEIQNLRHLKLHPKYCCVMLSHPKAHSSTENSGYFFCAHLLLLCFSIPPFKGDIWPCCFIYLLDKDGFMRDRKAWQVLHSGVRNINAGSFS